MAEFRECAVCGRTILHGERVSEYLDAEGETAGVCALCKPRAEASGWIPAGLAGSITPATESRGRRRLGFNLRRRFARGERPEADSRQPHPAATAPGDRPPATLEVFNASPQARKVAGLTRSLGAPRVSLRGEVITVAWDLSWYQWRVSEGKIEQLAHGGEVSELADEDRDWNASAAQDGTISLA